MRIEKIAIVSHESILYINIFDIVYCQSEALTVTIFLADGESHVVNKQLSKIQCLLPDLFVRISQCVLINKLYLNRIDKKEKQIFIRGNICFGYTMPLGKLLERIGLITSTNINFASQNNEEEPLNPKLEIA